MAYRQFSTAMTMWNSHALKSNAILAKSFYKCMSSSATAGKSLNVGFVGLGNMGARMANNLIQKVITIQNVIKKTGKEINCTNNMKTIFQIDQICGKHVILFI